MPQIKPITKIMPQEILDDITHVLNQLWYRFVEDEVEELHYADNQWSSSNWKPDNMWVWRLTTYMDAETEMPFVTIWGEMPGLGQVYLVFRDWPIDVARKYLQDMIEEMQNMIPETYGDW